MLNKEEIRDWEVYAQLREEAWQAEHRRQTEAYLQLEAEMGKLIGLLEESQRNQNDWMVESTRLFEQCAEDFRELRSLFRAAFGEDGMRGGGMNRRIEALLTRLEDVAQAVFLPRQESGSAAVEKLVSESGFADGERPGVVVADAVEMMDAAMAEGAVEVDLVEANAVEAAEELVEATGRESSSSAAKVTIKAKQTESPSMWTESPQLVHASPSHAHSQESRPRESSSAK